MPASSSAVPREAETISTDDGSGQAVVRLASTRPDRHPLRYLPDSVMSTDRGEWGIGLVEWGIGLVERITDEARDEFVVSLAHQPWDRRNQ